MKQMQNQRNDKGITLVALIITIIILVILAAVSISAVYNSKVVDYAVNGATDYAKESIKENEVMSGTESLLDSTVKKIEDILGGKTPGGSIENPPVEEKGPFSSEQLKNKIGKYVNYQPNTPADVTYSTMQGGEERSGDSEQTIKRDTNLKWRIMNVEGDKVTLISETIPTGSLALKGANGYNNGVKLLNDACNELYKNTTLGAIGRNAKVEDINGLMEVTPSTSLNSNYGSEYTIGTQYYPKIFADEKAGAPNGTYGSLWEQSDQSSWYSGTLRGNSSFKGKYTMYSYMLSNYRETNTVQYALATGQAGSAGSTSHNTYELASRCINCAGRVGDDWFHFRMFNVMNGGVNSDVLYRSDTNESRFSNALRPCIEIDLSKTNIGETGSGESTDPYSIAVR